MKSTVFFTMQTSATGSMWRIFSTCLKHSDLKLKPLHFLDKHLKLGTKELVKEMFMPNNGHFIQFNGPPSFNMSHDLEKYNFILNVRDPRDRLCNSFHWGSVHPVNGNESEDSIEKRRVELLEQGIDSWVLERTGTKYYQNLLDVFDKKDQPGKLVLSYARLCLDFDSFIDKFCHFMGIAKSDELLSELEIERTDNLKNNKRWIGNRWEGSDILPGRYKNELRPETISILNEKFEVVLRKMAEMDPDYANLYLEGL